MSELKAYLCIQAREIENKTFSCYNQTLAVKNVPEATMVQVYLKSDVDAAIAELKQKLEDAQATAYAESVDAGMENRILKRALWLARAEWARSSALSYHLIESHPDKDAAETYKRKTNKWEKVKDKCLKKAEEYK